jgi:hypothetical protein
LCELEFKGGDFGSLTVFIDCNPSFSIYTQMGLVSADYLIVPMMADYSSLEGIKGILSLLYGEFPTAALQNYAQDFITFSKQVATYSLELPVFYEFVFNNFTSNSGVATAYEAIKNDLISFSFDAFRKRPDLFIPPSKECDTLQKWTKTYVSDVKDFHTSGKVSSGLGIPLHKLPLHNTYVMPEGTSIGVPSANYAEALKHINGLVGRLQ